MAKSGGKVRRRIDRRDWTEYNRWQSEEVRLACLFLKDLVESSTIHDWERRRGRPRIPRRDLPQEADRAAEAEVEVRPDEEAQHLLGPNLGLARAPHFNTLQKYNRGDGITRTLENLLAETARPFWAVERTLAVDATGLVLFGSGAWRANHDPEARRDFAKLHVLSGTSNRATLAVRVTRGTWHDAGQLEPLLDEVPVRAPAKAVTGDGAYWSRACCAAVQAAGLQAYFSPRENARWPTHPKDAFERMTRFALQFPNRFGSRYHRRSTAESRFATEKALFGGRLRCRRPSSRRNEVLSRGKSSTTCGCSRRGCPHRGWDEFPRSIVNLPSVPVPVGVGPCPDDLRRSLPWWWWIETVPHRHQRLSRKTSDLLPFLSLPKGLVGPEGCVVPATHLAQNPIDRPNSFQHFASDEPVLYEPFSEPEVIVELKSNLVGGRNHGWKRPEQGFGV